MADRSISPAEPGAGTRVLVLHWKDVRHPAAGGAERVLHKAMRRLVRLGAEVHWFTSRSEGAPRDEVVDGIRVRRRGGPYGVYFWAGLLARGRYDLVIDSVTGIPWMSPLLRGGRKAAILYHLAQKETFFLELPKRLGRAIGVPAAWVAWRLERAVPRIYRRTPFVTLSDDTREELEALGFARGHVQVVQEGIDLRQYGPAPTAPGGKVVTYVGRLVPNKGVDHLIEGFALAHRAHPDAILHVVGTGYHEPELRDAARRLGIEKAVLFHGFLAEEDKVRLLQQTRVLVIPSLREGFATTAIEANACGAVAIGSDVPGVRNAVAPGVSGQLYPYGDAEALARRIDEFLADESRRLRMRETAQGWAKRFDEERMLDDLTRFFLEAAR